MSGSSRFVMFGKETTSLISISSRLGACNDKHLSSLQYPPPTRVVPLPRQQMMSSRIKSNTLSNHPPSKRRPVGATVVVVVVVVRRRRRRC